jgi:ABC-type multidrug transport system permease subunit
MLPLFMAMLFMASILLPRDLVHDGWFRTVATYNPLSYLVEANRVLLISGWDKEALALGCGIAAGLLVVAVAASVVMLKRRMA